MLIAKQGIKLFYFSTATNSVNLSKNYYKILEVDHSCDQKVIKKSYLKLVKTLHPDVNPHGKEKFTEVQEAYEVLSDNDLKKYYDQNNYCKSGAQTKASEGHSYSTQSGSSHAGHTRKSSSGHEYYTHRTYKSDNPQDYYSDNEPKYNQKANSNNKKTTEDADSSDEPFSQTYKNSQQYANKQSWQSYQQKRQQQQERAYQHQTPQQRQFREKLKAMRGLTSQYNVMWARYHLREDDLMTGTDKKEKGEELKNLMPDKVRRFYDKVMDKMEEIALKNRNDN